MSPGGSSGLEYTGGVVGSGAGAAAVSVYVADKSTDVTATGCVAGSGVGGAGGEAAGSVSSATGAGADSGAGTGGGSDDIGMGLAFDEPATDGLRHGAATTGLAAGGGIKTAFAPAAVNGETGVDTFAHVFLTGAVINTGAEAAAAGTGPEVADTLTEGLNGKAAAAVPAAFTIGAPLPLTIPLVTGATSEGDLFGAEPEILAAGTPAFAPLAGRTLVAGAGADSALGGTLADTPGRAGGGGGALETVLGVGAGEGVVADTEAVLDGATVAATRGFGGAGGTRELPTAAAEC